MHSAKRHEERSPIEDRAAILNRVVIVKMDIGQVQAAMVQDSSTISLDSRVIRIGPPPGNRDAGNRTVLVLLDMKDAEWTSGGVSFHRHGRIRSTDREVVVEVFQGRSEKDSPIETGEVDRDDVVGLRVAFHDRRPQ